jgi:hypothetical protein
VLGISLLSAIWVCSYFYEPTVVVPYAQRTPVPSTDIVPSDPTAEVIRSAYDHMLTVYQADQEVIPGYYDQTVPVASAISLTTDGWTIVPLFQTGDSIEVKQLFAHTASGVRLAARDLIIVPELEVMFVQWETPVSLSVMPFSSERPDLFTYGYGYQAPDIWKTVSVDDISFAHSTHETLMPMDITIADQYSALQTLFDQEGALFGIVRKDGRLMTSQAIEQAFAWAQSHSDMYRMASVQQVFGVGKPIFAIDRDPAQGFEQGWLITQAPNNQQILRAGDIITQVREYPISRFFVQGVPLFRGEQVSVMRYREGAFREVMIQIP